MKSNQTERLQEGLSEEERRVRDELTPYFLKQAYHLPGNSWTQDWWQYMVNNHPLFGICFHHRFHPVGKCVRSLSLVGSILFGISITNIIYLAFVFYDQDYEKTYVELTADKTAAAFGVDSLAIDENVKDAAAFSVTNGNLALWTVGAALHAVYDNLVWSLATCSCCAGMTIQGFERFRSFGVWLVLLLVIVVIALTSLVMAIRSAVGEYQEASETADKFDLSRDDLAALRQKAQINEFEFLLAYAIELFLNFFLFFPVISTVLFSGCLTCGKTRLLGGRPFEMRSGNDDCDTEKGIPTGVYHKNQLTPTNNDTAARLSPNAKCSTPPKVARSSNQTKVKSIGPKMKQFNKTTRPPTGQKGFANAETRGNPGQRKLQTQQMGSPKVATVNRKK